MFCCNQTYQMQKMPSRCKACPMVVLPAQLLLHPMTSLGQRPFHDINGNEKRKVLKSSKGCKAPGSSPGDKEKGWQACTLPVIVRTLGSSKRVFACSLDFNCQGLPASPTSLSIRPEVELSTAVVACFRLWYSLSLVVEGS